MTKNVFGWLLDESQIIGCSPVKTSFSNGAMGIAYKERFYSFDIVLLHHCITIKTNHLRFDLVDETERLFYQQERDRFQSEYDSLRNWLIEKFERKEAYDAEN